MEYRTHVTLNGIKQSISNSLLQKEGKCWFPTDSDWFSTDSNWFPTDSSWFSTDSSWFPTDSDWFSTDSSWFPTDSNWFPTDSNWFSTDSNWFSTDSNWFQRKTIDFNEKRPRNEENPYKNGYVEVIFVEKSIKQHSPNSETDPGSIAFLFVLIISFYEYGFGAI